MYPITRGFPVNCLILLMASVFFSSSPNDINISQLYTTCSQSNISAEAVLAVMTETTNISETNLLFLYSLQYEDLVQNINKPLSETYIGQMRFENDGNTEVLRQMLVPSPRPALIVVLERPVNLVEIFQKIRKRRLNSHVAKWLLITEEKPNDNSIMEIEKFVNEGTQVTICKVNSPGQFDLLFPYIDKTGVTRFFDGTDILKRERATEKLATGSYYSLSGREMKIAVKSHLFSIKTGKTLPDGSIQLKSGIEVTLLNTLITKLNFTYRAFIPEDNQFGNLQANGSISGIIGMVARREATFGMCALVISESRESVVDFSWLNFGGSNLIVSRSPKQISSTFAVFSPLQLMVWVSIIMVVLCMGPVVFLFSHFLNGHKAEDFKLDLTWIEFNMFRGIVNQGVLIEDASAPMRIIFIFWLFFCLIYTAAYSGMLTAMLAIPAYETPIDYLEDLPRAVKNGYTIGTLANSYYEQILKTSSEGIFKQTWSLFNHEDLSKSLVNSHATGAKKILSEKFVYITSSGIARYFQKLFGTNKFHLSRERFSPNTLGIACQTGSPVRDIFFDWGLRLQASGILSKWIDDEFDKIPKVQSANEEGTHRNFAISVTHLQAAVYMFLLGMSVASITLLIETTILI